MSGSRLGRGRNGRLALLGGCTVVFLFVVFLYRAATSEMAKLRELHLKCAQQQEALAAQLQVIFEYKARLEKSLAEEKSSNAAVKQELQQRASKEKSLRDKDSVEAMQRFNSLQQTYKLLQTEHQDLQEECKKREKQALDETNRLETTLQDLRGRIRQAQEEKTKSLERLKTKYLEMEIEKNKLEDKYTELLRNTGNTDSTIEHLKKEVFQLKRELDNAKRFNSKSTSPSPSLVSPKVSTAQSTLRKDDSQPIPAPLQLKQQVSPPQPLHSPRDYHADAAAQSEEKLNDDANEPINIRFVQKNGNIVPAGPSDIKEVGEQRESPRSNNDFEHKQQKNVVERPMSVPSLVDDSKNSPDDQRKQIISPLNQKDTSRKADNAAMDTQNEIPLIPNIGKALKVAASDRPSSVIAQAEDDELQALQERLDGILNHNMQ